MTEYIKNPLSGKLRGVTYEDGKIIDVHIRDTDDVVKVFVPVRHGRWIYREFNDEYGWSQEYECSECAKYSYFDTDYCPNCGARMDEEVTHER